MTKKKSRQNFFREFLPPQYLWQVYAPVERQSTNILQLYEENNNKSTRLRVKLPAKAIITAQQQKPSSLLRSLQLQRWLLRFWTGM